MTRRICRPRSIAAAAMRPMRCSGKSQRVIDGPLYRSWGDDPLPSRDEALDMPLRAFRSWYLRMVCGRCGRERWLAETHLTLGGKGDIIIRALIPRLRHGERCGGGPHLVELITGIPGIHPPGIRRIVLVDVRPATAN